MELRNNQWYVRWFLWSLEIWGEFRDENFWMHSENTNLCFFIRTTLISAPLAILANIVTWIIFVATITYAPISAFGGWGYFYIIVGIAVLIGLIFALNKIAEMRKEALRNKEQKSGSADGGSDRAEPGFLSLAWKGVIAQKKKVCPMIKIVETEGGVR